MPKKGTLDPIKLRKETREWLASHTIQDVRGIAKDLENAGEDVSSLVEAINELEEIVNADPTKATRRSAAKAEA